jgi:hypothetical protein
MSPKNRRRGMRMKVGKNLLYSALYALIMLGLILMRKNFDGEEFPQWMVVYLPVLFFFATFCILHWKKPLRRTLDRMNEWAYDMSFRKIIVMILSILVFSVVVVGVFFVLPIIIFES